MSPHDPVGHLLVLRDLNLDSSRQSLLSRRQPATPADEEQDQEVFEPLCGPAYAQRCLPDSDLPYEPSVTRDRHFAAVASSVAIHDTPTHQNNHDQKKRRFKGWRSGVAMAASATGIVLLLNTVLAIVAASTIPHEEGFSTIYEGECALVGRWSIFAHVLINILSSVLLSASNYTMQYLAAPTRADIDAAHAKGKSLDIGVPSLRNILLGRLAKRRVLAWWLICLSSLPLHFVFNSVIFKTTAAAGEVYTALVSPEFFSDTPIESYDRWPIGHNWTCATAGYTEYLCWDDGMTDHCATVAADTSADRDYSWFQRIWNNSASYYCMDDSSFAKFTAAPGAKITTRPCKTYSAEEVDLDGGATSYNCSAGMDSIARYSKLRQTLLSGSRSVTSPRAVNLTNAECIRTYSERFMNDAGPLLLVTSDVRGRQDVGLLFERQDEPSSLNENSYDWMCPPRCDDPSQETCATSCSSTDLAELRQHNIESGNWTITIDHTSDWTAPRLAITGWDVPFPRTDFRIDYCMSVKMPQRCKLQLASGILLIVIVCNVIKTGLMFCIAFSTDATALVTVGDAVSSFLDRASMSSHVSPESEIKNGVSRSTTARTWLSAAGKVRFLFTCGMCLASLLLASALLAWGMYHIRTYDDHQNGSLADSTPPLSRGFARLDPQAVISLGSFEEIVTYRLSEAGRLIFVVLFVNLPQVICSLIYFSYNYLLTVMLLSQEWSRFYLVKKPLRVSKPIGEQRSTYFLSLPYRYGVPLIIASSTLHWLISQSLFFARIEFFFVDMYTLQFLEPHPGSISLDGVSLPLYSCLPILLTVVLGFTLLFLVVGLGFRKLKGHMPVAGSSSLAIAAMCHRPADEVDAAYRPVSWGELRHDIPNEPCLCCFTSKNVQPPCYVVL